VCGRVGCYSCYGIELPIYAVSWLKILAANRNPKPNPNPTILSHETAT